MKRRRAQAALIACLILFVVAGSWRGGVVHRKHSRHHHAGRRPPPPAQELAAAGVATIRRQGCRLKKVDILCNDGEKNQSLVVDNDKRRVPTGSNPLHNRSFTSSLLFVLDMEAKVCSKRFFFPRSTLELHQPSIPVSRVLEQGHKQEELQ
ncbi:uncharacterized protein LOC122027623 isoform X3 [Zingiber officinale]|uniref:uncharacterized protein LOC122027623 isoform X3 n=1 Tax=Zingiber officinale TaxID=94328 RepID=UPI001C4AEC90|nr:uncharacterized protein LOC122027623 isoform X3 [Zingiber officinale]